MSAEEPDRMSCSETEFVEAFRTFGFLSPLMDEASVLYAAAHRNLFDHAVALIRAHLYAQRPIRTHGSSCRSNAFWRLLTINSRHSREQALTIAAGHPLSLLGRRKLSVGNRPFNAAFIFAEDFIFAEERPRDRNRTGVR